MDAIRLHEEFVKELHKKIPRRSELVSLISEILQIEKESVSRRLSEKVQFSVHEMGVIAKTLGLSIDPLIFKDNDCHWLPFILESPLGVESMEALYEITEDNLEKMMKVAQDPFEYGTIFNSYPLEYYVHHPHLMKFMFFKWGHYFVGSDEFNNYAQWKVPQRLSNLKGKIEDILVESEHTIYIWDEALIWTLVNEVDYFYKMDILSAKDVEDIKNDLKDSLRNLEKYIGGTFKPARVSKKMSFYVSNMNLGVSSSYMHSEKEKIYSFKTNFTFLSSTKSNYYNFYEVKNWIHSFKNISVLISDTGPLERKLFFLKQHKIIDDFLKTT